MVRVLWAAGSLIWSKEKQPKQKNSKDDLKKQKQKNTRVSSLYQVNWSNNLKNNKSLI